MGGQPEWGGRNSNVFQGPLYRCLAMGVKRRGQEVAQAYAMGLPQQKTWEGKAFLNA